VLRRYAPSAESLRHSRWLRWLGPRAREPQAWRFDRRRVSRGVAIGAFAAILVPLGQIPVAVVVAVLLRASPLAAAMATFISNPVTFGPIYYAAYQLGAMLLQAAGLRAIAAQMPSDAWFASGWNIFLLHGQPLLLGALLLATMAGATGYIVTQAVWRRRVLARRAKRREIVRAAGLNGTAVVCVPFAEAVTDEVCAP
jgi:hypothetical protein